MDVIREPGFYVRAIIEFIYISVCARYLFGLNRLNYELADYSHGKLSITDAKYIVSYNNNTAIYYFCGAIIIVLVAILITILSFRSIKNEFVRAAANIGFLVNLIPNFVISVWTCVAINNPIVRAIIIFMGLGAILIGIFSD